MIPKLGSRLALCVTVLIVSRAGAQTSGQATGIAPGAAVPVDSGAPAARRAAPEADARNQIVHSVSDPGTITTRQDITPAGIQCVFQSYVTGVAFGGSSDELCAAVGGDFVVLDWKKNEIIQRVASKVSSGMQNMAYDAAGGRWITSGIGRSMENGRRISTAQMAILDHGKAGILADHLGTNQAGGVVVASHFAAMALTFNDEVAVIDLADGSVKARVKVGIAPFNVALSSNGAVAYVSNLGGRVPQSGDMQSPTGPNEAADNVVVDARGVAASGTVSCVDVDAGKVTATIPVGLHPTALALDEAHNRLYVANSNSDTISVIDTRANAVVDTIQVQPFGQDVAGVSPEGLALSKDGNRLYAACAGINAVAVIRTDAPRKDRLRVVGLIPTAWYPSDIAISPDGSCLAVSTLLGVGSGAQSPNIETMMKEDGLPASQGINRRYVHARRGTVHVIPVPDDFQLEAYTIAVAENNHQQLRGRGAEPVVTSGSGMVVSMPVPRRPGDPSPIRHVVYIIKENRAYDQVYGSLGRGNGDPSLNVYDDNIVPNHRNLARQFVLLDNFYATGGNSGDGHQWVTQASETDYTYWPAYGGRSYPFEGSDPLAVARGGFIWNAVLAKHETFADFGEYAGAMLKLGLGARQTILADYRAGHESSVPFPIKAQNADLNKYLVKDYPTYGGQCPDVMRARIFNRHLKEWEANGDMPNLVLMQLPSDHTGGTSPGYSTNAACLADNDWALGQIVEGITHSKFWATTAIFVVEDDAQGGIDHVDGHRTVALAISPYIRRGSVDSTFYSHPSMLKTIELILGLPNLSLFDLIANDMRNSFQMEPDLKPYTAVEPRHSIYEMNPQPSALHGAAKAAAIASSKMDFLHPDAAPSDKLNEIIWHDAKGWNVPMPQQRQAVFCPYSVDLTDEQKEARAKAGLDDDGDDDGM